MGGGEIQRDIFSSILATYLGFLQEVEVGMPVGSKSDVTSDTQTGGHLTPEDSVRSKGR